MTIRTQLIFSAIYLFCVSSCTPADKGSCYSNRAFGTFTSYKVNANEKTPNGILLDDPKQEVDQHQLDQTIQNVSACVNRLTSTGFTSEEYTQGECWGHLIEPEIRECLTIKVAPDWTLNCDKTEQVFPCNIGTFRCEQKGLTPTEQCTCRCRAIIQPPSTIIVTPNLRLLPAHLTTMMTGCLSPWVGRLADCASPLNVPDLK